MQAHRWLFAIAVPVFFNCCTAAATIRYVDANGTNPVAPYTSWVTAATNIQDAINFAGTGNTILVTNGIYQYGGAVHPGQTQTNRVFTPFGFALTIQSVNGPAVTVIKGYQVPGTTNGVSAIRCVYLSELSTLSGFTLSSGATQNAGDGGGVISESNCTVTNCVITGNAASFEGGGSYSGNGALLVNCVIAGNLAYSAIASGSGGGAYGNVLNNCVVTNNFAIHGGGLANGTANNCLFAGNGNTNNITGTDGGATYSSTLNNCTLAGNFSRTLGAAEACTLNNCIIYYNSNGVYADCYQCKLTNCCTTLGTGNSTLPNNSLSNAPAFVDLAHGNCRLQIGSPGMDAGTNVFAPAGTDLDGNPRIVGGAVDLGAYENQNTNPVHYVSLGNSVPVSPFTNWLTAATNIQDAVAVAQPRDIVVVSNGIFKFGGAIVYGSEANRVALTNPITVLGLYGAPATVIVGSILSSATRCAYVGSNAVLNGFTLANGTTAASGDIIREQSGGGAWCEPGGVISNCFIGGNNFPYANGSVPGNACTAQWEGSAVYGGTVYNSALANNLVIAQGGAAAAAALVNCVVISNTCQNGYAAGLYQGTATNCTFSANVNFESVFPRAGGAYQSALYNCTLTGNQGYAGGTYGGTNYNCTLANNAGVLGGGVYSGVLYNCLLSSNTASTSGGGAYISTLYNCTVVSNRASASGGGVFNSLLYNCTVINNTAGASGGGAYATAGSINNSIVYYNFAPSGSNWFGAKFNYGCTLPAPLDRNTITNAPVFMNLAGGDYHEQTNSPTINAGLNQFATSTDFDGNPRIVGRTVDIGAYEYQGSNLGLPVPIPWLAQYGLPTDGSANDQDADGDGMNNWQEWIAGTDPTNALSLLRMMSAAPANDFSRATITWQSVSGVNYCVQRSSDFNAPPSFSTIATNLAGQPGTTSYTDLNAVGNGPFFYRVGVGQ